MALSVEQRRVVTRIEDATMVSRLRNVVDTFCQKQNWMRHMGLAIGDADPSKSFIAGSKLFTECFYLPCAVSTSEEIPGLQFIDPENQPPWMAIRDEVLSDGGELLVRCKHALPDFLTPQAGSLGRAPTPRARWKELWMNEPSTVAALEQQLAKLVEQVLWQMASDHAYALVTSAIAEEIAPDATVDCEVPFEDWMIDGAPRKKVKKKRKQTAAVSVASEALPDAMKQLTIGGPTIGEPAVADKVCGAESVGEVLSAEDAVHDDGVEEDGAGVDCIKEEDVGEEGVADDGVDDDSIDVNAAESEIREGEFPEEPATEEEHEDANIELDLEDRQANGIVDSIVVDCASLHSDTGECMGADGNVFQCARSDTFAAGSHADLRVAQLEAENARLRTELALERSLPHPPDTAQSTRSAGDAAEQSKEREVLAGHYWGVGASQPRSHWQSLRQIFHLDAGRRQRPEHTRKPPAMPACDGARTPKTPPPTPPKGGGAGLQPQQLVRYIWNQTGQMEDRQERDGAWNRATPSTATGAASAASGRTPASSSPWSHGYWSSPLGSRAIVKNTFIDICSDEANSLPRRPKSVSPTRCWGSADDDPDYWFR